MKKYIIIALVAAVIGVFAYFVPTVLVPLGLCAAAVLIVASQAKSRGGVLVSLANVAEGRWPGKKSYYTDAAIGSRYLLAKIGSDASHVALCGVADVPLGIMTDEAAAAEGLVNVNLLGTAHETQIGVASAAIAAGATLVPAANGKLRALPAVAGTYRVVGRALQAAGADGDEFAFDPCDAFVVVVADTVAAPAALTSSNGVAAAAAADLAALAAETEKVGDDVRALHGVVSDLRTKLITAGVIAAP